MPIVLQPETKCIFIKEMLFVCCGGIHNRNRILRLPTKKLVHQAFKK